jgi:hypothetical protein
MRVTTNFEENVLDLRVKAPFFNYVISQRDHKGQLMSVGKGGMHIQKAKAPEEIID